MLLLAFACAITAIFVFRSKPPVESPNSSRLYRVDNRVVGSLLLILALAFAVLAYTSGKLLF
jgi:hypothetical protein